MLHPSICFPSKLRVCAIKWSNFQTRYQSFEKFDTNSYKMTADACLWLQLLKTVWEDAQTVHGGEEGHLVSDSRSCHLKKFCVISAGPSAARWLFEHRDVGHYDAWRTLQSTQSSLLTQLNVGLRLTPLLADYFSSFFALLIIPRQRSWSGSARLLDQPRTTFNNVDKGVY